MCQKQGLESFQNIHKLEEKDKAAFYSAAEEWVLPAVSTKEPEEREFVVDSGVSMHVVSKKDLKSAELKTMRTSRSPTTVMTANCEVQTKEDATVYVKQLDFLENPVPERSGSTSEESRRNPLHWINRNRKQ